MGFFNFFSRQARKPTGLFGRFFMSRVFDKGNAPLNDLAFDIAAVGENERLLEIGCGTGLLLRRLADRAGSARLEGIDFSTAMAALARKNNGRHLKTGKVAILVGDFNEADLEPDGYDTVLSVNAVYFWTAPEAATAAIHRILKPGGRLIVGYHQKSDMETMPLNPDVFRLYSTGDMQGLLGRAFPPDRIETLSRTGRGKPCFCTVAAKA